MRPKTKPQHKRDGTLRKHRHGTGNLPVEIPQMPADMPASVQAVWKTVTGQLERAGIVSEVDGIVLRRLCELCWLATEAFDEVKAKGVLAKQTNKGGHTNEIPNPAVRVYFTAVGELTRIAKQFGMTPTGRLGMNFDDEDTQTEADDILGFRVA
jgi:P27 family predicted phage terminase small subunit